ncbi:MAG: phosphoserine phosphatase RsbU/P [Candidatus Sumerlaeota bacterium]|nr:phosphoserine phosphatase RsbU/P [Candidatus Sumerlaeota bacterium]
MQAPPVRNFSLQQILDTMADGVYVADRDRRIIFWNKSAERLTGWLAEDVVGHSCRDNILCHVDKDGHHMCGEEYCPLHRSIVTGNATTEPVIAFAQRKDGSRAPFEISIAPIRDDTGEVVAAVETFHDLNVQMLDLERARKIQREALPQTFPASEHFAFRVHYMPQGMIGGDFYAVNVQDSGAVLILIADIMGHGVAAALYTMYLRSIWEEQRNLQDDPLEFLAILNDRLHRLVYRDNAFATAALMRFDPATGRLEVAGAGQNCPLVFRTDGTVDKLMTAGLPLGLIPDAPYDKIEYTLAPGDVLLACTDGAVEIDNDKGEELGDDGLIALLKELGYPNHKVRFSLVDEALLRYSNDIRLRDDVTLLEMRYLG